MDCGRDIANRLLVSLQFGGSVPDQCTVNSETGVPNSRILGFSLARNYSVGNLFLDTGFAIDCIMVSNTPNSLPGGRKIDASSRIFRLWWISSTRGQKLN